MGRIKAGIPYKTRRINFALTEAEYDAAHVCAGALGITPSQLLRMLILEKYRQLYSEDFLKNLSLELGTMEVQNVPK